MPKLNDPDHLRRLLREACAILRRVEGAIGERPSLQLDRNLGEIEADSRAFCEDFIYLIETGHVTDDRPEERPDRRDGTRYVPLQRPRRRKG